MYAKARLPVIIIALCALAYLLSLTQLYGAYSGIDRTYHEGDIPALELVPASYNGTIVIAHGFCGDKEMMKPMGLALARNGYRVILFDSPGHGGSPLRMGDATPADAISQVSNAYAGNDHAVAGHSMGSLAIQYAMNGTPSACIGISPIYGAVNESSPKNLLLLAGSADIESVKTTAIGALSNGTGQKGPAADRLYGNFSDGTARKLVILEGDNHISILYDGRVYDAMVGWLDSTYGVKRNNGVSSFGDAAIWFLLSAVFAVIAFIPASAMMTRAFMARTYEFKAPAAGMARSAMIVGGAGVAAAALLYLTGPLPIGILLGDTISTFLLYMGIAGLCILWLFARGQFKNIPITFDTALRPTVLAAIFLLYFVVLLGIPASASIYSLVPGTKRVFFLVLMGAMLFPYNLLSELEFRGIPGHKSLLEGAAMRIVAIALLMAYTILSGTGGFLFVILPVLLPLFVILEALSYYTYRLSGNVLIGAMLNSLISAWLMASAFPLV